MNKKVSVIVLNLNGRQFLTKCLTSLKKQTHKSLEIIVADNNSSDESLHAIKQFADIILIENKKNYGYCQANNIAAQKARGHFLFFINNDVELFDNTVEEMMRCYQDKSIVTGRQIPTQNKRFTGSSGSGVDIFGYPVVDDDPKKTRVFYADGAMFFIKKTDFLELGGFDKKLFIFQEDIDLSWRAQMQGYKIISCWGAKLFHYGGATIPGGQVKGAKYTTSIERRFLNEKNAIRNILKNYSFPLCMMLLVILLIFHTLEIIILTALGKLSVVNCYLKAYWWNIKNLKNTLQTRTKIQRVRAISDFQLMKRMYFRYAKLDSLLKVGIPKFQ